MTTRNFRVNNGLECGDITLSASANTITGLSTSAPSGNGDVVTKAYSDSGTQTMTNKTLTSPTIATPTILGTATVGAITTNVIASNGSNAELSIQPSGTGDLLLSSLRINGTTLDSSDSTKVTIAEAVDITGALSAGTSLVIAGDGATVTGIKDEDNMASNSNTKLATQQSIKAYVDSEISSISSTSISQNNTNVTVADSGDGSVTVTVDGNTEMTITDAGVRVHGDFTVDGTTTTINTSTLTVEDNVIEVNRNVSANSGMPTFSGLKVNRGETSSATEQDLFWVWDESFADDGTTTHGNAGGAFTALRSQGDASPQSDFSLVDIRANVVHATSTSAQYADVAERFEADAPMSEGAVVTVGGSAEITETTTDLSDSVFGVVSTMPAYAMNAGAGNNDSHPFVAMTGRTPVRVIGEVTKGQRLVSSSTKGCARAVAQGESITPFHVIGRALESSTDAGIKLVNCAVRTNN
tara:strand:- start:1801 stop:3207 length:1407 start_codon:yes stop_codon:yes gene_type:complete